MRVEGLGFRVQVEGLGCVDSVRAVGAPFTSGIGAPTNRALASACQGRAGQGRAGQNRAGQGRAGQGGKPPKKHR